LFLPLTTRQFSLIIELDKLVCVRYRYDEQRKKRCKTVELIIEEVDWEPKPKRPSGETIVDIKVDWGEVELGRQVRGAGGKWNPGKKVWELRYDQVLALGLEDRIVEGSI
jgi:hypothetical protein